MKALVAVEPQLRSGLLFLLLHGKANGIRHKIHCLSYSGLVDRNAAFYDVESQRRQTVFLMIRKMVLGL